MKLFKKPFGETIVGNFLTKTTTGKMILGAADTFTFGAASNVVEATETSPSGKADVVKLASSFVVGMVLIYLFVKGYITFEEAEQLKELTE